MKQNKNCDLLFEYLRSILYDPDIQTINMNDLDESYQKLGQGLQFLEHSVSEMRTYSDSLSRGNLSVPTPSRDNFLCENLKSIHANLNHLTWQAKQVAKGDYSQTVSYLGEFSEAFNTMTTQLQERELSLKEEAEREKSHADMVESYNQLLMQLIDRSNEDILVTSADDRKILYCHQQKPDTVLSEELYTLCMQHLAEQQENLTSDDTSYKWIWETENSRHRIYRITTGLMEWQGQKAYAHIILDITDEKHREQKLTAEAYQDPLTGIGNRHFLIERMTDLLYAEKALTFCYFDLDHLKYINDNFGHMEGDWYLQHFVHTVQNFVRKEDIFARMGGDEFCLIMEDWSLEIAQERLTYMQTAFEHVETRPYPKGFSFGVVEIPSGHEEISVNEIIAKADKIMYQQKKQHKQLYMSQLKQCQ